MDGFFNSTVALSPPTATLLISLILPLVVAAAAKIVAPAWVKAAINLGLATVLGLVTILSQAGVTGVPMKRLLAYVLVAMVASDLAYNYVWKPLGVWPLIQQWTDGFGFGGGASEQPLNPNDVLTPPPGGVGEGVSARDSMRLHRNGLPMFTAAPQCLVPGHGPMKRSGGLYVCAEATCPATAALQYQDLDPLSTGIPFGEQAYIDNFEAGAAGGMAQAVAPNSEAPYSSQMEDVTFSGGVLANPANKPFLRRLHPNSWSNRNRTKLVAGEEVVVPVNDTVEVVVEPRPVPKLDRTLPPSPLFPEGKFPDGFITGG